MLDGKNCINRVMKQHGLDPSCGNVVKVEDWSVLMFLSLDKVA